MMTFLKLGNILPVAIAGIAVAFIGYLNDETIKKNAVTVGGADDDGI